MKKDKKDSIVKDYEKMIVAVLTKKDCVNEDNLRDVIRILLRLVSHPTREQLRSDAKKTGMQSIEIHHDSGGDLKSKNYIATLSAEIISGEIEVSTAIGNCLSSMKAVSKNEHASIHCKHNMVSK